MKLTITREQLYGGPLSRAKRYQYVAKLDGKAITTGDTRVQAEQKAYTALLGAWEQTFAAIYATAAADGCVITTRMYAPGEVESSFHRTADGRGSSHCMSRAEVNGVAVSAAEYHAHFVAQYNSAVMPVTA